MRLLLALGGILLALTLFGAPATWTPENYNVANYDGGR